MACHELSQSAIPEGSCTEAFVKVSVEGADRQKSDGGERDWGGGVRKNKKPYARQTV